MPNDDTDKLLREYLLRQKRDRQIVEAFVKGGVKGARFALITFVVLIVLLLIVGSMR